MRYKNGEIKAKTVKTYRVGIQKYLMFIISYITINSVFREFWIFQKIDYGKLNNWMLLFVEHLGGWVCVCVCMREWAPLVYMCWK